MQECGRSSYVKNNYAEISGDEVVAVLVPYRQKILFPNLAQWNLPLHSDLFFEEKIIYVNGFVKN